MRTTDRRHVIALEPLAEEASLALVEELVGPDGVDGSRFQLLLEKAGGNPLFLEETVRMLADTEQLSTDTSLESLSVPESLQALIGSRLDALPAAEKRVAQQASVVGAVFWRGAVAHLAKSGDGLDERLQNLEHRDFVHPRPDSTIAGDREYDFRHILIRDVAYERLPKGRRVELHVRFSEWINGLAAPANEVVEILAYHLEQACRLAREVQQSPVPPPVEDAAAALKRAGEKAERRGGIREADRYYARALELLDDACSQSALELRVQRAFTRNVLGEVGQAVDELSTAADDARARGHTGIRGTALAMLGQIDLRQGRVNEAREHLSEAQDIANGTADRTLQVKVMYRLSALCDSRR
jgi:predicted ATPase